MPRHRHLALLLMLAGCTPPPTPPAGAPHLIVLIAVDQLRPDYLDRFAPDFSGGFAMLLRDGVFYTNARQEHALTQTAPGHATMLSGRPPASTGIISNDRGAPDSTSPLVGSNASGASPARFRGTTLLDWLRARTPASRAVSVGRKDRSAIMMVGRGAATVLWYGGNGRFVTSTWYARALPPWLERWNAKRGVMAMAGETWNLLLAPERYAEPDSVHIENRGRDVTFPHRLPSDSTALVSAVADWPWMDSLTLDLALAGVRARGLGKRGVTDLLAIALSSTDGVGHDWGPDSREMHDHLIRLDRWLGAFLDSLAAVVPSEQTVIALTADHGIASIPQLAREWRGEDAWAYRDTIAMRYLARALGRDLIARADVSYDHGVVLADTAVLAAAGIAVDSLREQLAAALRADPGVARVLTPDSLAAAEHTDTLALLWQRQLPHDVGWLAVVALRPGRMWSSSGMANHGNPTNTDIIVPMIIRVPGGRAARVDRPVRVTQLGPTLAGLAGVPPTEPVDRPLVEEFPSIR